MQKTQLVERVSNKFTSVEDIEQRRLIKEVINATFEEILAVCSTGDETCLVGFGKFVPRYVTKKQFRLEFRPSETAGRRLNQKLQKLFRQATSNGAESKV